jgi:Methylase involved in ubiquinone/menaquinone biosynthesis
MQENLKEKVKSYWNVAACGTEFINKQKYSREYFESVQNFRYSIEPEIFSFAQFTRFHGKKVLEVGVGAGTDFLQWAKSGAECYGIDLTEESISHVTKVLEYHNLKAADIRVGDAENIPYQDNFFDLTYSWGVIHHSPDTVKALQELIRVTKPGGKIKCMVYNRHSLFALYMYMRYALLKGKPFQSFAKVLYNHQESPGTKAYTFSEIKKFLRTCLLRLPYSRLRQLTMICSIINPRGYEVYPTCWPVYADGIAQVGLCKSSYKKTIQPRLNTDNVLA